MREDTVVNKNFQRGVSSDLLSKLLKPKSLICALALSSIGVVAKKGYEEIVLPGIEKIQAYSANKEFNKSVIENPDAYVVAKLPYGSSMKEMAIKITGGLANSDYHGHIYTENSHVRRYSYANNDVVEVAGKTVTFPITFDMMPDVEKYTGENSTVRIRTIVAERPFLAKKESGSE